MGVQETVKDIENKINRIEQLERNLLGREESIQRRDIQNASDEEILREIDNENQELEKIIKLMTQIIEEVESFEQNIESEEQQVEGIESQLLEYDWEDFWKQIQNLLEFTRETYGLVSTSSMDIGPVEGAPPPNQEPGDRTDIAVRYLKDWLEGIEEFNALLTKFSNGENDLKSKINELKSQIEHIFNDVEELKELENNIEKEENYEEGRTQKVRKEEKMTSKEKSQIQSIIQKRDQIKSEFTLIGKELKKTNDINNFLEKISSELDSLESRKFIADTGHNPVYLWEKIEQKTGRNRNEEAAKLTKKMAEELEEINEKINRILG